MSDKNTNLEPVGGTRSLKLLKPKRSLRKDNAYVREATDHAPEVDPAPAAASAHGRHK